MILILSIAIGCSSDNGPISNSDILEFESFGMMEALVNGEKIVFSADKAKKYAFDFLTIYGRNCSKRMGIRFDIPFAEGTYTLESLGYTVVVLDAASACPNENGSISPQTSIEAQVIVEELTTSRVKGSFSITVGETELALTIITDGIFDIERE